MLDDSELLSKAKRHHRNERYSRKHERSGNGHATLLDLPICAIDGEGVSHGSKHSYTQLCASWPNGRASIESDSLSFERCMEFLLALPENHVYVIYGGNYDFNMMLARVPFGVIDKLLDTGETYYKGYNIAWVERKWFSVAKGSCKRVIYDVLANFQVPFVKLTPDGKGACESWNVGTPEQIEIVRAMKKQRGVFKSADAEVVKKYCYLETDLLRELCRKLFDAIKETGYKPRAVYGPGALASAAMEKHGIKKYLTDLVEPLQTLTRYAYFGGRFDCSMLGWFDDVWQYDIKSAYPDQIRYLPCLSHAQWHAHSIADYQRDGLPVWGMIQVEWNVGENCPWPPFPLRTRDGNVYYPYTGRGWYHAAEVAAAIEMYGDQITYVTGWRLEQTCEHQPFAFVDALYRQRAAMPRDQGIVIKLVLNSLYGKTAQQVGSKKGKRPVFQSFFWAGAITAGTRAKLLRAIAKAPAEVYGVATDGIVVARQLDMDVGDALGQWEAKQLSSYAQISNGVYRATDTDGKPVERARGFGRANLDWDDVQREYRRTRGAGFIAFTAKSRFVGLREARSRLDRRDVQCTWISQDRQISFWPPRRWPEKFDKRGPTMQLTPLAAGVEPIPDFESQPFRLKSSQETLDKRMQWNPYDWQDYA